MPKESPLGNLRRIGILRRTLCTYSLHLSKRQNESRFVFPECLGYKKRIAICYPTDLMNQNRDPDWLSYVLREAKNEFRLPFPCTLWSKIRIPILLSECPGSEKWIPICVSGHSVKPKMNSDFAFRVSGKLKMNLDLRLRTLSEAKNELRFRFRSVREAKNELRFCILGTPEGQNESRFRFPECPKAQNELRFCFTECPKSPKWITILLPGVSVKQNRDSFWASFCPLDRR